MSKEKKWTFTFFLLFFSLISIGFFYFFHHEPIHYGVENIIYQGEKIQMIASPSPLLPNSLNIEAIGSAKSITQWNSREHEESYNLLQNVAELWRKDESIDDFMVIGKIPFRGNFDRFSWEIIPFHQSTFNFIDQFSVLWHLTINPSWLTGKELQALKNKYKNSTSLLSSTYQPIQEQDNYQTKDAFCNPAVIAKQLLYEGHDVLVLYNYAPIGFGEDKLHFLIIPKAHRTGFPELTLEEYVEAQKVASKIIQYFEKKGFPIVYLYHKTGKYAGQTVFHWHEHLIFVVDETHVFFGKLIILFKRMFHSKPLSNEELEEVVKKYGQQVQEAMQANE